ncbi:LysR family transcriptional regulator [Paraburkholderia kururiensis]|uniref:LysR family transcriptional regulator n=1 Tax=Paraburkholderia kururiensis TaxID=984307 RepID=UPI0005A9B750|nr:LysR family transcriptional regulator [Paraburkholderia kururiensis]
MEMNDLAAFVSVARAGGFRDAARASGVSASSLSAAVRRLETKLGLRLLNRTTRSVAPTEAGQRLVEKLTPLFAEMEAALDVLNGFRDKPAGTLKLNVPSSAARIVLPSVIAPFLQAYPGIRVEVVVEDGFVDVLAVGCDAGIRYDERLEQDMIAVPIGPRVERFAAAAAPAYLDLHGRPEHPRDLLGHVCLRGQFAGGAMAMWIFERDGEVLRLDPPGTLVVRPAAAMDLLVSTALAGVGVIHLFEDILRPHLESGALEPILEPWWQQFSGPFLYYPGHRHVPAPLRAFIDFLKRSEAAVTAVTAGPATLTAAAQTAPHTPPPTT